VNNMIEYIEDGDLWRWQKPDGKAFYAGFNALGLELDANAHPGIFEKLLGLSSEELITQARTAELSLWSTACIARTWLVCILAAHCATTKTCHAGQGTARP
jgi:hypothetical protein